MQNDRARIGGALVLGLGAGLFLLKFGDKARRALRGLGGVTHRSGASNPDVRATADPARGMPA